MTLWWVIGVIAAQRAAELLYARRNARALLARGGVELAGWQHPLFVALHAAWLLAMLIFISPNAPANWWLLSIVIAAQALRIWAIASLGPYWTTQLITLDDAPIVRKGPYAFFPHPNYLVVCIELALVPAAFGAWWIAVLTSILNAGLLSARIKQENRALAYRKSCSHKDPPQGAERAR
jgi:methyltransferase